MALVHAGPRSARDLAIGLAQGGTAAGVVMSVQAFDASHGRPGGATEGDTDELLARFTRSHPEWLLQRTGHSVRVVHRGVPPWVLERLERERCVEEPTQMSASAAVIHIVGSMIEEREARGVLGSGLTPSAACRLGEHVNTPAGPTTVLAVLDVNVTQAGRMAWFVLYDADRGSDSLELGLWCEDGMYSRVTL